jgi:hypothetical protein
MVPQCKSRGFSVDCDHDEDNLIQNPENIDREEQIKMTKLCNKNKIYCRFTEVL